MQSEAAARSRGAAKQALTEHTASTQQRIRLERRQCERIALAAQCCESFARDYAAHDQEAVAKQRAQLGARAAR